MASYTQVIHLNLLGTEMVVHCVGVSVDVVIYDHLEPVMVENRLCSRCYSTHNHDAVLLGHSVDADGFSMDMDGVYTKVG